MEFENDAYKNPGSFLSWLAEKVWLKGRLEATMTDKSLSHSFFGLVHTKLLIS